MGAVTLPLTVTVSLFSNRDLGVRGLERKEYSLKAEEAERGYKWSKPTTLFAVGNALQPAALHLEGG